MNYGFHEYANLFPLMDNEQLAGLTGSIFNNGFHVDRPIMLFEDKILDGRNRYLACKTAQVMPLFKQFTGNDEQALLFVTRENMTRNHYSTSQRALIGARLKPLFEEQAKKRQQAAGRTVVVLNRLTINQIRLRHKCLNLPATRNPVI